MSAKVPTKGPNKANSSVLLKQKSTEYQSAHGLYNDLSSAKNLAALLELKTRPERKFIENPYLMSSTNADLG